MAKGPSSDAAARSHTIESSGGVRLVVTLSCSCRSQQAGLGRAGTRQGKREKPPGPSSNPSSPGLLTREHLRWMRLAVAMLLACRRFSRLSRCAALFGATSSASYRLTPRTGTATSATVWRARTTCLTQGNKELPSSGCTCYGLVVPSVLNPANTTHYAGASCSETRLQREHASQGPPGERLQSPLADRLQADTETI